MDTIMVLKVSGKELDDETFLNALCRTVATMQHPVIVVHGGGKEISAAMEQYGQQAQFIDGIRVTPPESMAIMQMVVCGSINKRIVALLVHMGKKAIGLSGIDLGLLHCQPYRPHGTDLGRVGHITHVDVATLRQVLSMGWLPVCAPVVPNEADGVPYNVNADHVAQGIAAALSQSAPCDATGHATEATELVFVSDVAGVFIDGKLAPCLTVTDVEHHIAAQVITGGMIPKVRSALASLAAGVASVRITNLAGLVDGGTAIV